MKILLVEDEKITRITLTDTLESEGYQVLSVDNGESALDALGQQVFDTVISDLRLPKVGGLEILKHIKTQSLGCTVIVITAFASVETAVKALKLGAYDYLTKPFSPDKLLSMLANIRQLKSVENENIQLKRQLKKFEGQHIVGHSSVMQSLLRTVETVAKNDYTVLIEGESGTGKEVFARALHRFSPRAEHENIVVNCAAIPETLLESELFGHEKGSFTGADKRHIGYFERANKGSIFIDDIDDVPLSVQVKLLRVIQEKELVRVGGTRIIKIDVRIICATKKDLRKMANAGTFREDLYYRLNIIPLKIPPLRQRLNDIPDLLEHFFQKHDAKDKLSLIHPKIVEKLMQHHWPGNVRELENFVERIIALSGMPHWDRTIFETLEHSSPALPATAPENSTEEFGNYENYISQKEKKIFQWALDRCQNNVSKAADLLDLPRSTFRSKMEKNKFIE